MRRIERRPDAQLDPAAWPYTLAPVRQLVEDGLDLPPGVTFLVGENGSGKSTIVEAVAMAYGLNPEGGSTSARHRSRQSESDLYDVLRVVRNPGAPRWSYFLRAETMHGLFTYLEASRPAHEAAFHEMSHGESFLEVLRSRFDAVGFYLLDEPESALSFSACLGLIGLLADLARSGAQVLCATHSPLLASLPGATVLQLDGDGYRPVAWEDLELVGHWRSYLEAPQRYLRHVLAADD
ncbi:MAG: AAA family ATPase [Actinomycetes bacterium]